MDVNAEFPTIARQDPDLYRMLMAEVQRQANCLELIASENHVSRAVLEAVGSVLTNKYAEGYPGKRYYGGCEFVDQVEELARQRVMQLFGCEHVNVQPHSGSQANMAAYMAVLNPGETILSLDLSHGGHLTHGLKANFSGKLYQIVHYGVSREKEVLDYDEILRLAREHKPRMIVTGASAYPRIIDFAAFGRIAKEVGAYLMADIAHIAGMVAVGLHPSPIPYADFVTTTVHKTLRGPRSGMIMCKAEHAKAVDSRIFPGIQGGPLMHVIAGKAVAFGEALRPEFKDYQQRILANARALAKGLTAAGYRLVSGGTDNHLMLVDLRQVHADITGKQAEGWLEAAGLIVNKNMIPFDERKPTETSGLRIGTPAVTTRGLGPAEMQTVAELMHDVLAGRGSEAVVSNVRQKVLEICKRLPDAALRTGVPDEILVVSRGLEVRAELETLVRFRRWSAQAEACGSLVRWCGRERWCGNPFPHLLSAGILSRESFRRSASALLAVLATLAAAGCAGSGTVKVVPFARSDFTDHEPLIQNVPISEAYWWLEPDGRVNVALRFRAGSLLGKGFGLDWQMSLVLEGMPAGSSRLYNLNADSVRVVQTYGADQRRSRGWMGVAVLHAPQGSRLRGRFHADVRQQQFGLLTGWSPPYYQAPMMVVVGEFEAVSDAKSGEAVRQATEAAGFERAAQSPHPPSLPSRSPLAPFLPLAPATATGS